MTDAMHDARSRIAAPTRASARLLAMLVCVGISAAGAQDFDDGRGRGRAPPIAMEANLPYDGAFEFARIRFGGMLGGFRREPVWSHDYPRAEANFTKILAEVSAVRTRLRSSAVIGLDDPALFQHAVAYIVEVGYWVPNETEVTALRTWLRRGGFLIVDDFQGQDIMNFEEQMRRVLPDARLMPIPREHPVFDSFYHFTAFEDVRHPYSGAPTTFVGIFEHNDPHGRLMAAVNYNGDIAEYWEFADQGFMPIAISNEAFKLGVNYVVYALTR
jgi:hypothetical protein